MDPIKLFCQVAELRSFSEVARLLRVAPSSVSRQIDKLEAELGVALFRRTTRGLVLTAAGEEFFIEIRHALSQIDAAKEKVRATITPRRLVINVFESFGTKVVVPAVLALSQSQAALKFTVNFDNQRRSISRGAADLFVRLGKTDDASFKFKRICLNQFGLFATKTYLQEHGMPKVPADLLAHNCLLLHRQAEGMLAFTKEGKEESLRLQGNFSAQGSTALAMAAKQGLGIAVLPQWYAHDEPLLMPVLSAWQVVIAALKQSYVHAIYPQELSGNQTIAKLCAEMLRLVQPPLR